MFFIIVVYLCQVQVKGSLINTSGVALTLTLFKVSLFEENLEFYFC